MDDQERKQAASIMGQSKSDKKVTAARENGKLGGRPLTLKGWAKQHKDTGYKVVSAYFGDIGTCTGQDIIDLCQAVLEYNQPVIWIDDPKPSDDFDGYRRTIDDLYAANGTEKILELADWYVKAERRVSDTPELEAHHETIFADWPEGDEHYEWIATAPVAKIVDWAEAIEAEG